MTARLLSAVVAGACLVASCAVGERPILTNESLAEEGPAGARTAVGDLGGDPGPAAQLPPPDSLGEAPPILLSPTGVVVPVLERRPGGYLVLTPCGGEAELVWGQPIRSAEVVLDPGHGGNEPGALGPSEETEAELNLDIARRAAAVLDGQGVTVVLTRTGDYRIPISNRAAIADQLSARAFVSIHHNAPTPDPSEGPGTEVYVQVGSEESGRLGGLLHQELVGALSAFDVEWTARTDAGVLTVVNDQGANAYGINRYPQTPSALAELAYLSNPSEAALLATPEYRQAAAEALARALVRYLRSTDAGSAVVERPRLFNPSDTTGGSTGCVDPPLG